jgi:hypothetical protein
MVGDADGVELAVAGGVTVTVGVSTVGNAGTGVCDGSEAVSTAVSVRWATPVSVGEMGTVWTVAVSWEIALAVDVVARSRRSAASAPSGPEPATGRVVRDAGDPAIAIIAGSSRASKKSKRRPLMADAMSPRVGRISDVIGCNHIIAHRD